jgi:hypothetical protein
MPRKTNAAAESVDELAETDELTWTSTVEYVENSLMQRLVDGCHSPEDVCLSRWERPIVQDLIQRLGKSKTGKEQIAAQVLAEVLKEAEADEDEEPEPAPMANERPSPLRSIPLPGDAVEEAKSRPSIAGYPSDKDGSEGCISVNGKFFEVPRWLVNEHNGPAKIWAKIEHFLGVGEYLIDDKVAQDFAAAVKAACEEPWQPGVVGGMARTYSKMGGWTAA